MRKFPGELLQESPKELSQEFSKEILQKLVEEFSEELLQEFQKLVEGIHDVFRKFHDHEGTSGRFIGGSLRFSNNKEDTENFWY